MKKFLLSLTFAFFSFSLFAVSLKDFSLSVEPLFGMKWGQLDEYVFSNKSYFSDDKLSELNWEIKNELQAGLKLCGGWKGIFAETKFTAGIPRASGIMKDSDWQNIQYAAASGGNTIQTNYSESDNHIDHDFSFEIKGGYEFKLLEKFRIKPSLGFEYNNIKFTASNGTYWYGNTVGTSSYNNYGPYYAYNNSENQTTGELTGDVIDYKRISYYLWLGSDFSFYPYYNFIINAGFFVAPYFYAVSYDSHLLRSLDFADLTIGYFSAFKGHIGFEAKITEKHSIIMASEYCYLGIVRGDDYQKSSSSATYTKSSTSDGGAGAKWFDLSLSYRFKIF
ncbi:omptin family outer membrane protease [Treponema sp.]|uniref:omptin family outer membrane protease n=1 Tax=Treponema sp. TaxID=166 RepID=UPI00388E09F5